MRCMPIAYPPSAKNTPWPSDSTPAKPQIRSSPRARIAYARNLPNRFSVKSESRSPEPAGRAFSTGSTTIRNTAAAQSAARSNVRIPPLGREQPRRAPLDEQDHEDQDRHLAEPRAERRLDDLVEAADAERGQDAAEELPHPARHHDH